jgi:hypothetical protein
VPTPNLPNNRDNQTLAGSDQGIGAIFIATSSSNKVAGQSRQGLPVPLGTNNENMANLSRNLIPKLHKAPQPPLSHIGAIPDSERAKRPPLAEPPATGQELNPGDRVEGLGNFGKKTGEFGTVEQANEDDAVVKWDDDGRMRLHQPSLRKVEP